VPRESNSPTNFLADHAKNLQLNGWLIPKKCQDLQDVHITEHNIYFINSMPVGLKGILINDMRLSRVTAKRLTGTMDAIQVITSLIDNQSLNSPNMNKN
jgi:hypothetical protein